MSALLARLAASASIVIMAAACGNSPSSSHSSASCGGPGTAAGYMTAATVVFIGVMLPGVTVQTGSGDVLASPAKARAIRYLKGTGPSVVTIETGVSKTVSGVMGNSEGIEPAAGQRWKIYAASPHMPYQTSICMGSMLMSSKS